MRAGLEKFSITEVRFPFAFSVGCPTEKKLAGKGAADLGWAQMTLRQPNMLNAMKELIKLFATHSHDRSTFDELLLMIDDDSTWSNAHDLFQRIRQKTLAAERHKDELADCQYLFEEACAKTLYNLSEETAPFDSDSPYWIVPNALILARLIGIDESKITKIVAG